LHVSQNTMKTHLKNIYRKIGASGREEAVAKAKNLYIL
jgi:ATP/maltotriose-dependent transcriptional regulator MalT